MSQPKSKEGSLGCAFILVLFLVVGLAAVYLTRNPDKWDEMVAWVMAQIEEAVPKEPTKPPELPEAPVSPDLPALPELAPPAPLTDAAKNDGPAVTEVGPPHVTSKLDPTSQSKPKRKPGKRRAKTQVEKEAEAEAALAAAADVPAPGSFAVVAGAYFSHKLAVGRLYDLEGLGVRATIVPDRVEGNLMWLMVVSGIFPDFPAADSWVQSHSENAPSDARVTRFNGLK